MASYKVLQDIEAEDKLVGPLTLRQCIYAAVAILGCYLSYLVISKGAPYLAVVFVPFVAGGAFFAFPWSKQQTTEVWALAKIRFALKPRKRIWNQSGVKQQVTITAPRRQPTRNTRSLSPTEVQSRLRALADTIDSRGWAVKNIELGYYTQPGIGDSDRLIDPSSMSQEVPELDSDAAADIFDTDNNAVAHKFDNMMTQSADAHHQQLVKQMSQPPAPQQGRATDNQAAVSKYWHMKTIQPPRHDAGGQAQAAPAPAVDYGAIRTPGAVIADNSAAADDVATPQQDQSAPMIPAPVDPRTLVQSPSVTDQPDPAILELANNNDLNVATLAREAQARKAESDDEVVINLH